MLTLPLPISLGTGSYPMPLDRTATIPEKPAIIDGPSSPIPITTPKPTGPSIFTQATEKAKSMLQFLPIAAQLLSSNNNSGAGSDSGGLVKTPWDFMNSAKPSFSTADGKSGDINQTTTFGDFIVNGNKFSAFNSMLLLAGSVVVGVILIRTFKGKKK